MVSALARTNSSMATVPSPESTSISTDWTRSTSGAALADGLRIARSPAAPNPADASWVAHALDSPGNSSNCARNIRNQGAHHYIRSLPTVHHRDQRNGQRSMWSPLTAAFGRPVSRSVYDTVRRRSSSAVLRLPNHSERSSHHGQLIRPDRSGRMSWPWWLLRSEWLGRRSTALLDRLLTVSYTDRDTGRPKAAVSGGHMLR